MERRKNARLLVTLLAAAFAVAVIHSNAFAQLDDNHWVSPFWSFDRPVHTIAVDGDDIYVGGEFRNTGTVAAIKIAHWDGMQWSALGSGVSSDSDYISDIVVLNGDVYACGTFTQIGGVAANHVARWDGTQWYAMDTGSPNVVYALEVVDGEVYAGGTSWLARWDGAAWQDVATTTGTVRSIAPAGTDLYVAGSFTTIDGVSVYNVARNDGSAWSALGGHLAGSCSPKINDVCVDAGDLFVAGEFLSETGNPDPLRNIADWDGSDWNPLAAGVTRTETYPCDEAWANTVASFQGAIVVGGYFETAGGSAIPGLAYWNGSAWGSVGGGVNGQVIDLVPVADKLYVAGSFTTADGDPSAHFAIYDISTTTGTSGSPALSGLELRQNSPNPFNPSTSIPFMLEKGGHVRLDVVAANGAIVRTLVDGPMPAGSHTAHWNGLDARGVRAASGVYLFRLTDGRETMVKKGVLLK